MKSRLLRLITGLILLLLIPAVLLVSTLRTPAQFGESYYGEIPALYENLKNTEGRRIILIGNSALAFGARTDLLTEELDGYTAVLFGVYGAVGTKAMLELARDQIRTGDIVVIAPELYEQTASLYFSPQDYWRAADGDASMLKALSPQEKRQMVYAFTGYAAEKYQYAEGMRSLNAAVPYARAAFENAAGNNLYYMVYDRPNNIMPGGYDAANLPILGLEVFGEGFIDYLNEYAAAAEAAGASVYFGFTPLNSLSLGEDAAQQADAVCDYLRGALKFDVLGHPAKYIYDYRLFYDNNVHVNSAGALYYTDTLAEDLKIALGLNKRSGIALPAWPDLPVQSVTEDEVGDADCFLYEVKNGAAGEYIVLTGLTEEGKKRTELTLPASYDGLPVRSFAPEVFAGNTVISRIVLPQTITTIYDGSFSGAVRLRELVFRHDEIRALSLGQDFLEGAENCYIYIKKGVSAADCAGGWARYASRIRSY